jgi:hypothetical protein
MPVQSPTPAPPRNMQGVAIPAESVNPTEFFRRTRRHIAQEGQRSYTGDPNMTFELRKSDILSGLTIRFTGNLVVTPGTGSVASTARWPYDFLSAVRFTANGASNLINVSGAKLKARDLMKRGDLNDRGVTQTVAGVQRSQGTLALASEAWGVGSNTTALAGGTYPVDLTWYVPVAEDDVDLAGAIFLQTATADLTLSLDFASLIGSLFAVTGNGTVAITSGVVQIESTKYSIPIGPDGQIVVPDLSVFHSLIQSRVANGVQTGENELRLIGQGAGKSLLRMYYQLWNGSPSAPVPMTAANFGIQAWRYAGNETPDVFIDGSHMRVDIERRYGSDLAGLWGFGCHDFVYENAFRDVVDLGTTAELRLVTNIQSTVSLNSPAIEYVTESVFAAGQA